MKTEAEIRELLAVLLATAEPHGEKMTELEAQGANEFAPEMMLAREPYTILKAQASSLKWALDMEGEQ